MSNIREYIKDHILYPLTQYPTVIQDTMIEIITDKLEELYGYTLRFPSIVTPDKSRLDILRAIANQFLFTVREDADLQEQIDILNNILYVYNRRGSIDTIENMWKYYGGDLPKEVKVIIPSYNLFRYSMSTFSGTHSFIKWKSIDDVSGRVDLTVNSPGVYEIKLFNNTYPIPELREFLLNELVAAGNEIYFTNALHMQVDKNNGSNYYKYNVRHERFLNLQLELLKSSTTGLTLSGNSTHELSGNKISDLSSPGDLNLSSWSGPGSIFLEVTSLLYLGHLKLTDYIVNDIALTTIPEIASVKYLTRIKSTHVVRNQYLNNFLDYSHRIDELGVWSHMPDSRDPVVNYSGYFIVGETLLGMGDMEVSS